MTRKLTGKALDEHEAGRDIWAEVLKSVDEIRAGGGKRTTIEPKTAAARARLKSGLTQAQFAEVLGISRRTLEHWEQGRREPSGG